MSSVSVAAHGDHHHHNDIVFPSTIPFLLVHLACFAVIWTGFGWVDVAICVGLYFVRMFGVTAGFHRYFSHRSYKTSRVGQFLLGFLCQTSAQKGILWWAAKHRQHHLHADTPEDAHSPVQSGFLFSHVGWIFSDNKGKADYDLVKDLSRYPELRWLERHPYLPATVLAVAVWLAAGWSGLVVGFFVSTVLLYHGTFSINSLAHTVGRKKYITGDESRNNWFLALITLGEGWHNNHHHYQSATRQGFRWWEIDITYYVLRLLAMLRIVRDLREPPEHVVHGEARLRRRVVERAAERLAHSFPLAAIAEQLRAVWHANGDEAEAGVAAAADAPEGGGFRREVARMVPTMEELRHRADELFSHTSQQAMEQVVQRGQRVMHKWLESALHDVDEFPGLPGGGTAAAPA